MSTHSPLYRTASLTLVFLLVLTTTPVSASELAAPPDAILGSVSAVGSVQLRGMTVSHEATVFAGDVIRSRADSRASLRLTRGQKIQLGANTQVKVDEEAPVVKLALAFGHLAFASDVGSPLSVAIAPLEIYAEANASGDIAIVGDKTVGVRVSRGSVLIRNTESQKSFVLLEGEEKLIGRYNGIVADPIAVIASNMPLPIPSTPPAAPQAGTGISSRGWVAIIAAVAGGAAVGAFFLGAQGELTRASSMRRTPA